VGLFLVRFEGLSVGVQLVEDPLIGPTVDSVSVDQGFWLLLANLGDHLQHELIKCSFAARPQAEAHNEYVFVTHPSPPPIAGDLVAAAARPAAAAGPMIAESPLSATRSISA
jgi:hypothetical protein